ncbi:hypothetical protein GG344DRAFT_67425 [Lentinula edodes]|nr:hypothetical protein GG344DRAFT_67425 [Lentinula edodes]
MDIIFQVPITEDGNVKHPPSSSTSALTVQALDTSELYNPTRLEKKNVLRFNPRAEDIQVSPRAASMGRLTTSTFAPRVGPSDEGPSQIMTGFLCIRDALDGTSLGYVSSAFNSFGEYGPMVSPGQRLEVSINTDTMGPISIVTTVNTLFLIFVEAGLNAVDQNGPDPDLPFMVGITGFANDASGLRPGKYNYIYLGAGNRTAADVSPRSGDNSFSRATGNPEGIESTIFSLRPTLDVMPFWINGDGSKPNISLGLYENVLFLTGDKTMFVETFGPVTWVILSFEPES